MYIANFPEISRNGIYSQKSTPAGGKQQSKQKPAKTPLFIFAWRSLRTIKDGEASTGLQQQRPPNAQARPETTPLAFTPRPGARIRSQNLQGTSLLFLHEAPRSQSGSGCSSTLAREPARRLDIRDGRLAERTLPVASLPISLEAQALALGAVAPSGAECSSARGGARLLPSEHSRDTTAGVGFMHSARRAGPKTPPLPSSRAGRVLRLL